MTAASLSRVTESLILKRCPVWIKAFLRAPLPRGSYHKKFDKPI
jgi:hypothetical protein